LGLDLALLEDDGQGLFCRAIVRALHLLRFTQDRRPARNHVQGRSQFVRNQGQEIILGGIGPFGFLTGHLRLRQCRLEVIDVLEGDHGTVDAVIRRAVGAHIDQPPTSVGVMELALH